MELTNLENTKFFCRKYHIHPSKKRGQNFLISRGVLNKMVEAADLKNDDVILEIGPGFGTLTIELAKRVKKVVAVEADKRLAEVLRENLRDYKNIEIVEEDILKFSIFAPKAHPPLADNFQFSNKLQIPNFKTKIQNTEYEIQDTKFQNYGYKIVANLPYQITSAVFRKFLENEPRPSEMTVMVQKEVAERICGGPGEMSLLSVSVQFFGKPEIVKVAPRRVFWPEPEVDSAILKISQIKNKSEANLKRIRSLFVVNSLSDSRVALKEFFRVVKIGFSARRKQLHNNLSGGLHLSDEKIKEVLIRLGFDPKIRAQDLSVEDWMKLANQLFVKY